ncbi:hypothetical protein U9M48_027133 [Paspalum notatum var. saurae]|uniref:Uncharacterized protein n=1 Tax=Paspalum notatum var. saurae TaxID=547442 RepID=A0AAQ3TU57_PASNO
MTVDDFYPRPRDFRIDRRFWTVLQASLYESALQGGHRLMPHAVIDFDRANSVSGLNIRRYFEHYPGLVELMTRSHKYVEDWVRVFYATLYVADQRHFIQFMFDGREHRWSRERMSELLGVPLRDRSLHSVVYDGVSPPYRGHAGTAPPLDQVGHLFRGEMLADTPRTPDRLRPEF